MKTLVLTDGFYDFWNEYVLATCELHLQGKEAYQGLRKDSIDLCISFDKEYRPFIPEGSGYTPTNRAYLNGSKFSLEIGKQLQEVNLQLKRTEGGGRVFLRNGQILIRTDFGFLPIGTFEL